MGGVENSTLKMPINWGGGGGPGEPPPPLNLILFLEKKL